MGAKRRKVIWLSAERWKHGARRFRRRRCGSGRALLLPFTHFALKVFAKTARGRSRQVASDVEAVCPCNPSAERPRGVLLARVPTQAAMADEEHEHAEKVAALSLKDLRALVKEAGLSSEDCIEKAQLRLRAAEAVERLLLPGAKLGPVGTTLGLVATAAAYATERSTPD